jgi:hypothetical protein
MFPPENNPVPIVPKLTGSLTAPVVRAPDPVNEGEKVPDPAAVATPVLGVPEPVDVGPSLVPEPDAVAAPILGVPEPVKLGENAPAPDAVAAPMPGVPEPVKVTAVVSLTIRPWTFHSISSLSTMTMPQAFQVVAMG